MRSLEKNVRIYPWYLGLRECHLWMPVFFLFFASLVPLEEVLLLEAAYYLTVVILEVPSGYASDRVGRVPTLIISAVSLSLAYTFFVLAGGFWGLLAGQIFLATGLAFSSGTDTSLLFDSLANLGRVGEYGDQEARAGSISIWSMGAGGLIGGILAVIDLRLAYAGALVTSVGLLVSVFMLKEPQRHMASEAPAQAREVYAAVRRTPLAWLFAFAAAAVAINHLPYEYYQRYLELSLGQQAVSAAEWTPVVSGVHLFSAALIAGAVARHSVGLARRFGYANWLIVSVAVQLGLVGLMAWTLHPAIALILVLRGLPSGMQRAPINALVSPRLDSAIRATYLSLQSLAGRLTFAIILAISSWAAKQGADFGDVVLVGFALGVLIVIALMTRRPELDEAASAQ